MTVAVHKKKQDLVGSSSLLLKYLCFWTGGNGVFLDKQAYPGSVSSFMHTPAKHAVQAQHSSAAIQPHRALHLVTKYKNKK